MNLLGQFGQSHITDSAECRAYELQSSEIGVPAQREPLDDQIDSLETLPPQGTRRIRGVAHIAGAEVIYTYEEPENVTDSIPLLLTPGYCGIKSSYRQLRHHIAEQGKPAISYRPARTQKFPASLHPSHLRDVTKLSSQVAWGVMRDVAEKHNKDQFDLSGHSFGGKTAVDVSNHKPEYVRSVLLVASVGLHGPVPLKEMKRRGRACINEEVRPNLDRLAVQGEARMALEALHYVVRNPIRTLREGIAAGTCDIRDDIINLRYLGIRIGGLLFGDDCFFEKEDVQKYSGHLFDTLKCMEGDLALHIAPQLMPEPVAQAQLDILREMHQTSVAA